MAIKVKVITHGYSNTAPRGTGKNARRNANIKAQKKNANKPEVHHEPRPAFDLSGCVKVRFMTGSSECPICGHGNFVWELDPAAPGVFMRTCWACRRAEIVPVADGRTAYECLRANRYGLSKTKQDEVRKATLALFKESIATAPVEVRIRL